VAELRRFQSAAFIFTSANADAGGADINAMIKGVVATDPRRMTLVQSLGTKLYFSLLRIVNVVVGNSSSGLIEAPSFGTPTVNVGDRQKGRLSGPSVISVPAEADAIAGAINRALTPSFRNSLSDTQNPYGQGDAATSICDVVASLRFPLSPGKSFQDAFDNP
jgi:UDP-N-acetylglucosamine 2-epimerase